MLFKTPDVTGLRLAVDTAAVFRKTFSLSAQNIVFEKGQHTVLIGGNGAGKSTLIEAILGVTDSEVCEISVGNTRRALDLQKVGAQLQSLTWNPEFKVTDIIRFHKALYGRQDEAARDLLGIDSLLRKNVSQTSRGERLRIDLFMTFSHKPDIIFLDEPSTGLDAGYMDALFSLMEAAKKDGSTIVSATHDPREIALADQLIWLQHGRVRATGLQSELIAQNLGPWKATITPMEPESLASIFIALQRVDGAVVTQLDDSVLAYGPKALADRATQLAGSEAFRGWGVSRTEIVDLLNHISAEAKAHTLNTQNGRTS